MCCPLVFEFSVGIGGFVIGLGQISFFFSLYCLQTFEFRTPLGTSLLLQIESVAVFMQKS